MIIIIKQSGKYSFPKERSDFVVVAVAGGGGGGDADEECLASRGSSVDVLSAPKLRHFFRYCQSLRQLRAAHASFSPPDVESWTVATVQLI